MLARRTLLSLSLAALMVAAGLVTASNMGFKWEPFLTTTNTDLWISIPYKSSLSQAGDVCGVVPNAVLISRFDTALGVRADWTCPQGNNFTLNPGEGLFIRVSANSSPVFVGSHDPELPIPVGGFAVAQRDYYLSIPYHTTSASASDLCAEVPEAVLVSRFDPVTTTRQDWTCPFGNNFGLILGEAVAMRVDSPRAGFLPAHY